MVKLKGAHSRIIDQVLGMEGGYVLNFSDRTMREWFDEECGIDIYDEKYSGHGTSKAKYLRCFIETEDAYTVTQVLRRLWDYRAAMSAPKAEAWGPPIANNFAESIAADKLRYFEVITTIEGSGVVPRTDAINKFTQDHTLEQLVTAIERDISANKPDAALDRLHTYCMKKFAHLLTERSIAFAKDDPLHSRVGLYIKELEKDHAIRPISLRIMKSAISIFDSYNGVRNTATFAHDTVIVDAHEARFIFDTITSILRFLKTTETSRFGS